MQRLLSSLRIGFFLGFIFSIGIFPQANFQGLGYPPGGGFYSSAESVSAEGDVVVGYSYDTNLSFNRAFIWINSSGINLLGNYANEYEAHSVSDNGDVVVGDMDVNGNLIAFRWTNQTGLVQLGTLGGNNSQAWGISDDGQVIVGYSEVATGTEAFRWTQTGGMQGLGTETIYASNISGNGQVIVGTETQGAFYWTDTSGVVQLPPVPGDQISEGFGASIDGSIIVGHSGTTEFHACYWSNGSPNLIGTLPGYWASSAWAVSADGSVIVGEANGSGPQNNTAWIWDSTNGLRELKSVLENDYGLDLTDWQLQIAKDISANGKVIVGQGINPDGNTEAFRVELPQLIAWSNPAGGTFSVGSNWVGGSSPNDEQVALFDTSYFETSANKFTPSNYQPLTITFDDITTTKGLRVSRSQIIFDLLQHSYGVNNLSVGGSTLNPSESQLEIINGAIGTTNTLNIAENGDQGQLIIGSEGILEFNPQTLGETLQIGVGGGCPDGEC